MAVDFEWRFPTRVVFGAGRFRSLKKEIRGMGRRAFIVTSRSFDRGERAGTLAELRAQLKDAGVETRVFGDIEPNPRVQTVDRAAAAARAFNPRYILALGGGSVMDAAKCVALIGGISPKSDVDSIGDYVYRGPAAVQGRAMKPFNHALPVVCVPTVAATGSETSIYAVVTEEASDLKARRKCAVFGEELRPTLALIDPELTYSVGPRQTVDGAFDMMTHLLESYLSTEQPAPIQDAMTEALIETVVNHLPRVLENPRDELGRTQLSWCAALALSGVMSGRDGGWPAHALAHGVAAVTDAPHGRALAMILPRLMAFDSEKIGEKIAHFNKRIFGKPSLENGLVAYMKQVGAWTTLSELLPPGLTSDQAVAAAADHALAIDGLWKRGTEPYLANIRPISRADAIAILRATLN